MQSMVGQLLLNSPLVMEVDLEVQGSNQAMDLHLLDSHQHNRQVTHLLMLQDHSREITVQEPGSLHMELLVLRQAMALWLSRQLRQDKALVMALIAVVEQEATVTSHRNSSQGMVVAVLQVATVVPLTARLQVEAVVAVEVVEEAVVQAQVELQAVVVPVQEQRLSQEAMHHLLHRHKLSNQIKVTIIVRQVPDLDIVHHLHLSHTGF